MIDWFVETPALLVAVLVLFGPGLLVGFLLRLRGLALWALAPLASTAIIAVLAVAYGMLGAPWTVVSALLGFLMVSALAALAALALGSRSDVRNARNRETWLLVGGLTIGVVLGAARVAIYIGGPQAISQTNDAVFHLNALRFIMESGSASSFELNEFIGSRAFYPAAWHGVTSLVALGAGTSAPVAANMVSLVIAAGVWPIGIAWLSKAASGSTTTAAFAAALSALLLTFPLLMFEWGVLYPYALSLALVPAATAIFVFAPKWLCGHGPLRARRANGILVVVIATAGFAAIALSQPASLLTCATLVVCWFTGWMIPRIRAAAPTLRPLLTAAVLGGWLAFGALRYLLTRLTNGAFWSPFRGRLTAVLDAVLNGQVDLPYLLGVSVLMAAGLVVSVRHRELRWLAAAWLLFSALYVVCAAIGQPWLRQWLLGAWYGDPYRLAALAPLTVVPLAAIGLTAIVAWTSAALSKHPGRNPSRAGAAWGLGAVAAVGVAGLVAAPIVQMPKVFEGDRDTQSRYDINAESFLSADERALLERLPETVPKDSSVIGNPSTGVGFAYVLSGSDVFPRTWSPPGTESFGVLSQGLRDASNDPRVCLALEQVGADYVLDFGPGEAAPGRYVLPGMSDFQGQDGFELVDRQGDASLWRITACR